MTRVPGSSNVDQSGLARRGRAPRHGGWPAASRPPRCALLGRGPGRSAQFARPLASRAFEHASGAEIESAHARGPPWQGSTAIGQPHVAEADESDVETNQAMSGLLRFRGMSGQVGERMRALRISRVQVRFDDFRSVTDLGQGGGLRTARLLGPCRPATHERLRRNRGGCSSRPRPGTPIERPSASEESPSPLQERERRAPRRSANPWRNCRAGLGEPGVRVLSPSARQPRRDVRQPCRGPITRVDAIEMRAQRRSQAARCHDPGRRRSSR